MGSNCFDPRCPTLLSLDLGLPGALFVFLAALFKAVSAAKQATITKHVLEGRVNGPGTTLVSRTAPSLDETVIDGQIVSDGSMPTLVLAIVWETFLNIVCDFSQGGLFGWSICYCHADECNKAVRWFAVLVDGGACCHGVAAVGGIR